MRLKLARLDHRIIGEPALLSIPLSHHRPFWKFSKMQTSSHRFIAKLILVSAILAVSIKEIGPQLKVPETLSVVLVFVLLPTVLTSLVLGLQYFLQHRQVGDL
jgi:hypothetical protein